MSVSPSALLASLWCLAVVGAAASAPAAEKQTQARGTVLVKRQPSFSFISNESAAGRRVKRRVRLCLPRHVEYSASLEFERGATLFDFAFCPVYGRGGDRGLGDCLRFSRVPHYPKETVGAVAPWTPGAPSVIVFREREFEFFLPDCFSRTVQSWLRDEWGSVEEPLRSDFFHFLSVSYYVEVGLGMEVKLLLATMPVEQIRRYRADEVKLDDGGGVSLCELSPSGATEKQK